jgi:hypothetical protein
VVAAGSVGAAVAAGSVVAGGIALGSVVEPAESLGIDELAAPCASDAA